MFSEYYKWIASKCVWLDDGENRARTAPVAYLPYLNRCRELAERNSPVKECHDWWYSLTYLSPRIGFCSPVADNYHLACQCLLLFNQFINIFIFFLHWNYGEYEWYVASRCLFFQINHIFSIIYSTFIMRRDGILRRQRLQLHTEEIFQFNLQFLKCPKNGRKRIMWRPSSTYFMLIWFPLWSQYLCFLSNEFTAHVRYGKCKWSEVFLIVNYSLPFPYHKQQHSWSLLIWSQWDDFQYMYSSIKDNSLRVMFLFHLIGSDQLQTFAAHGGTIVLLDRFMCHDHPPLCGSAMRNYSRGDSKNDYLENPTSFNI